MTSRLATLALLSAFLALPSCVVRPIVPPAGCDLIDEVPGLREEMRILRLADDARQHQVLPPITGRLRSYAKSASVKCAYDRRIGASQITVEPKAPWWRFWRKSDSSTSGL